MRQILSCLSHSSSHNKRIEPRSFFQEIFFQKLPDSVHILPGIGADQHIISAARTELFQFLTKASDAANILLGNQLRISLDKELFRLLQFRVQLDDNRIINSLTRQKAAGVFFHILQRSALLYIINAAHQKLFAQKALIPGQLFLGNGQPLPNLV